MSVQVCRACMKAERTSLLKLDDEVKNRFVYCTRIEINPFDEHSICRECVRDVHACYDFIIACRKTDELLKRTVKNEPEDAPKLEPTSDSEPSNLGSKEIKDEKRSPKNDLSCPVCRCKFPDKGELTKHTRELHPNYERFTCRVCSKNFAKIQYLTKHLVVHAARKPFVCNICSKLFGRKSQLVLHRRKHFKEKPFKCEECEMSFYGKGSLINHAKLHRGDEHLCDLCGQKFAQMGNLKVHMRVHTGEKPYACSTCPFKCSAQSGMRRHERTHLNFKPHACPVCHKSFNNSGVLTRHKRIHTGELPYECSYCSKAFIDSWKRKNHLVKVHNIAVSDIPTNCAGRKKKYVKKK